MMKSSFFLGLMVLLVGNTGCRESEEERLVRPPENSLEAASELETIFADSDPATQKHASIATQALREGQYDKAVASIMNLRNQENLSFEQGMTLRNSMVTLQRELLEAAARDCRHVRESLVRRPLRVLAALLPLGLHESTRS